MTIIVTGDINSICDIFNQNDEKSVSSERIPNEMMGHCRGPISRQNSIFNSMIVLPYGFIDFRRRWIRQWHPALRNETAFHTDDEKMDD